MHLSHTYKYVQAFVYIAEESNTSLTNKYIYIKPIWFYTLSQQVSSLFEIQDL